MLFSAVILASLINPYGLKGFLWPFHNFINTNSQELIQTISEYESPFAPTNMNLRISLKLFNYLIVASIILLVLNLKKLKLSDLFILGAFFILSVSAVRFISFFGLATALILPKYLDLTLFNIFSLFNSKFPYLKKFSRFISPATLLSLIILLFFFSKSIITDDFYRTDNQSRRFGFGPSEITYPLKAADFVLNNNLEGKMFNTYKFGAFLNWKLYPQYETFIHGAVLDGTIPETLTFYETYRRINQNKIPYDQLVDKYTLNFFFLDHNNPLNKNLIISLFKDKNWALVYLDNIAAIYLKRSNLNREIIAGNEINTENIGVVSGNIHLKNKRDESIIHNSLGTFMSNLELYELAAKEYQKAINIDPEDFSDYINLANTYRKLDKLELAESTYLKAVDLRPDFAPAHFNLANYYLDNKRYDQAKSEYEKTLKINKKYPKVHYNLGVIFEVWGHVNEARKYYLKELEIQPDYRLPQLGLDRLSG